ncbi:MAG: HEAT repeat domain-containing protein [Phycisphaerales bacterium]|nr:HEAT repeat domain-containing protein [Phycisphaerales bacterium]
MSILPGGPRRPHDPLPRPALPARSSRPWLLIGPVIGLCLLTGCGEKKIDAKLDSIAQELFSPRRTPEQYMIVAVSAEDADIRRDAITRIARADHHKKEWAIKGFMAIACLESDAQTRCVAIRALARTGDPRAAETVLKILNYRDHPAEEVYPPSELVRWDAAVALADLLAAGQVPEEQMELARTTCIQRLRYDTDRHARIAAARGLGSFPDAEVIATLIAALRDDDFAVVHQCEESLVRLTGVTHSTDVAAWEAWQEGNAEQLFAQAGTVPEQRRPPYSNSVEKMAYETRDVVEWLWPGPAK